MARPQHTALYEISLYQRESLAQKDSSRARKKTPKPRWEFKTFGFFDVLKFRPLEAASLPASTTASERHERTLLVYGDPTQIEPLLDHVDKGKSYLAVALIKLDNRDAHEKYRRTLDRLVGQHRPPEVVLGCLDAADIVVLKEFGAPKPLENLIRWMKTVRGAGGLDVKIERKLTMIACADLDCFYPLAELDPPFDPEKLPEGSRAEAIFRITDRKGGAGLRILRQRLKRAPELSEKLKSCAGYYDVQGILSVPEAATMLRLTQQLKTQLATSTCFIGRQAPDPIGMEDASIPEPDDGDSGSPLLPLLKPAEAAVNQRFAQLKSLDAFDGDLAATLAITLEKFRQLDGTGFAPGSRLLLWACHDGLRYLEWEAEYFLIRQAERPRQNLRADFHQRQRNYAEFFRWLNDEIDRRVSLSLPAYTRFFPCAIEAPLKIVGALDVIGRLLASSYGAYQCREKERLLQVFSTKPGKPTYFRDVQRDPAFLDRDQPFTTIVAFTLSPSMLAHFHLAAYSVMHEVTQCVIKGTNAQPSFTALVLTHALVEWMAGVTTLVALGTHTAELITIPDHIREWTRSFLVKELGESPQAASPRRKDEASFMCAGQRATGQRKYADWQHENLFNTQAERWIVRRVQAGPEAARECYHLCRDALAADRLYSLILDDDSFNHRWGQELHNQFGVSAQPDYVSMFERKPSHGASATEAAYGQHLQYCQDELRIASQACALDEYVELASLVSFLRLFANDDSMTPAVHAIGVLITEYFPVWRGWLEASLHPIAARRFVVAAAALDIFQSQRRAAAETRVPVTGRQADGMIQRSVKANAIRLLDLDLLDPRDEAQELFIVTWQQLATPARAAAEYQMRECHPIVINGMVRYLVRLLHIYDVRSEHIRTAERRNLPTIDRGLRQIFDPRPAGAPPLPVDLIAKFWTAQYVLTSQPTKSANFGTVANAANCIRQL